MPETNIVESVSWQSYPKVWNAGHGHLGDDFFRKTVLVEEKIDGSQFSFGSIGGILKMKTHHQDVSDIEGSYHLFTEAIAYVRKLFADGKLHPEWTYRVEVIQKPCHNKLAYERVPKHHMVGFDICTGNEVYLGYIDKQTEFQRLDLETVPYYHYGIIASPDTIETLLDRRPLLGGKMIEGIVIKAYGSHGEDGKTKMAKIVRKEFRELKQDGEYKPSVDFIESLIQKYRTEARWEKGVQHMAECGELKGEPRDIGPLMGEVTKDLWEECGEAILNALKKRYWPHIARGCTGGLAEWYKRKLMENGFAKAIETPSAGGGILDSEEGSTASSPVGTDTRIEDGSTPEGVAG